MTGEPTFACHAAEGLRKCPKAVNSASTWPWTCSVPAMIAASRPAQYRRNPSAARQASGTSQNSSELPRL